MKIHLILCFLGASLLMADGAPGLIELSATLTYTNPASHYQFPPKLGEFARAQIKQYDNEGRDIGVGYNHLGHSIAVTVFVYPVAPNADLEGHFDFCKSEILGRHKDARSVADRRAQVSAGGQKRNAKYACYTFTDVFAQQRQPLRSELYLFSRGRWFIKFRATYPASQQTVAEPTLKTFINDLAWP